MEACVCGGSLSTIVNGSPTAEVSIGRGLKQGDPLVPSMFLIAAEGLKLLMSRALEMNLSKGLHFGGEGPPISLLQFTDDTLIIGETTMQNLWCLKAILRYFTNLAAAFLHCKVGQLPFKHLGLPLGANPRKLSTWKPMLDGLRKPPNSVIKEIVAIQRDFLWRGVKDGSKIPWVK
uniref:Reverse transcriptase domain-containing protein n=1 Tax=Cajanus cajan TaxID=3821 RepID=A0A151SDS3_CAJCA|nr:hypothetical protein KK1_025193 [Cajanus cajan]